MCYRGIDMQPERTVRMSRNPFGFRIRIFSLVYTSCIPCGPWKSAGALIVSSPHHLFESFLSPAETFFHDHLGDGKGVDEAGQTSKVGTKLPPQAHRAPDLSYNGSKTMMPTRMKRLVDFIRSHEHPTFKICPDCGEKLWELNYWPRKWHCPRCKDFKYPKNTRNLRSMFSVFASRIYYLSCNGGVR